MDAIAKAAAAIASADGLLIGASNGLSIAEGYNIFANNEMFKKQFGRLEQQYGIRCVLEGIFFNYPSKNARDEFFKILIRDWIEEYVPSDVMLNLRAIAGQKEYFIVTSNGDMHLEKAGFEDENIFEIEGTFITAAQNLPVEDKTVLLREFIANHNNNPVFLELGIGSHNQLIKTPMMDLAQHLPNSKYVIMNLANEISVHRALAARTIAVAGDLKHTLALLAGELAR